ncbi:KAT8 regulatory NSL complex subunit 1-like [Apus apus]|uniref:KAT8 regulatory NSL complex subunit 1-like n=1 Tax=Apus apus TaxID=8895 RepID=UPI0021F8C21B|nr:KAT8 regulatory NSL complex subunit 1-like [Apus apus]
MKKQGQPWSVSLVTSKKNQWLLPPSSVPRYPTGSLPCCPQLSSQSSPLTLSLGIPLCPSPSCSPTSGSPAPFRACTTAPCQGNGVLNCLPPSSSSSSSLVSGKAEGRFGQQTPQNPPARLDETCVAARIRPVRTWWRRQLVQAASGSHCSRRPLRPLPVRCSCEWPSSCILCSCRVSLQTLDPNTMSLAECIALLDSGFHPLLSLSQGSLCEGRGQPKGASSHSFPVPSPQAHKYGPLHHPLFLYPETPALPASQTPSTASSALSSKRRKAGCSYDIDNMVIPMSITAVAQVEKPQYKEIVVPRYLQTRPVDPALLWVMGGNGFSWAEGELFP